MCAGTGGSPGFPSIRDSDGMIAVPQQQNNALAIISGTSVLQLTTTPVFDISHAHLAHQCPFWDGYTGFSKAGTFYVAAQTDERSFSVGVSYDMQAFNAQPFALPATVPSDQGIRWMWLAASKLGEGALVTIVTSSQPCPSITNGIDNLNSTGIPGTVYAAHILLQNGAPTLVDWSQVTETLTNLCGDLVSSSLDADGAAYVPVYSDPNGCLGTPDSKPITLYVQTGGPVA